MSRKSALAQYSNIDVEEKAASESPSQLISLLFDKACVLLRQGGEALSADDYLAMSELREAWQQVPG